MRGNLKLTCTVRLLIYFSPQSANTQEITLKILDSLFGENLQNLFFEALISETKIDLPNQNFCQFSCNNELLHSKRALKGNLSIKLEENCQNLVFRDTNFKNLKLVHLMEKLLKRKFLHRVWRKTAEPLLYPLPILLPVLHNKFAVF